MDIKNIIVFLIVFFLILWLQHNDDKKFNKVESRVSLYDKVKIPLVSALFVILIKELDFDLVANYFTANKPSINASPSINSVPSVPNLVKEIPKNPLDDIFIGPPDF